MNNMEEAQKVVERLYNEFKSQFPDLPDEVIFDAIKKFSEIDPEGIEDEELASQGISTPRDETDFDVGYELEESVNEPDEEDTEMEEDKLSKLFSRR